MYNSSSYEIEVNIDTCSYKRSPVADKEIFKNLVLEVLSNFRYCSRCKETILCVNNITEICDKCFLNTIWTTSPDETDLCAICQEQCVWKHGYGLPVSLTKKMLRTLNCCKTTFHGECLSKLPDQTGKLNGEEFLLNDTDREDEDDESIIICPCCRKIVAINLKY